MTDPKVIAIRTRAMGWLKSFIGSSLVITRVRNAKLGGDNPFEWRTQTTADIFAGKRIVLFALPGAFTPARSDSHLPGYERLHDDFTALGIDRSYASPSTTP